MSKTGARPKIGEGRISGVASVAIGILSILAVLCLRFPSWLTTPELRAYYNVDLLRLVLALAMGAGFGLAALSFILNKRRHLSAVGFSTLMLAIFLGGPYVPSVDIHQVKAFIGLDWLVLDLFFTSVFFILLEWVLPRATKDQTVLRNEWKLDLGYFALNHLLIGAFLLISTHFAHDLFGWAVNPWTQAKVVALPAVVRFLLIVVVADLAEYISHRAYHEVPFLWRFHAVHHSPQHMDWLSGSRLHIVEVLITRAFVLVPIFVLGFPQETIFLYVIFISVQSVVIHSNLALDFGWLRYFIVTPHFHHWHHASDEEAIDKNYCAHMPLFDLLLGTYHMPKSRWPKKYGTVKPVPGGFTGQFFYPFAEPVKYLIQKKKQESAGRKKK